MMHRVPGTSVKPPGDPAVHFLMVFGADNRAPLIKKTLDRVAPHVNYIRCTDTGATDGSKEAVAGGTLYSSTLTSVLPLPLMHEEALRDVPIGDWVYYCDSDECPSPQLLVMMRYLITKGEEHGIGSWELPCLGHWFDSAGQLIGDSVIHTHEGNLREMSNDRTSFASARLIKRTDNFFVDHNGSHYCFRNDLPSMFVPLPWNHYKGAKSRAKSQFIHGLSHPLQHGLEKSVWVDYLRDCPEFTRLDMGTIAKWTAFQEMPLSARQIIDQWEHSENDTERGIWRFVNEFHWDGDEPFCTHECCKYE